MARRGLFKRPINSVKNIVDSTNLNVTAGTTTTINLAVGVNAYAGGVTDVPIGAKVAGVYLFVQGATDSVFANIDWFIIKRQASIPNPVPGATGGSPSRRYILHEEKGIPSTYSAGGATLTYRGFIKIPKGRQRFGEDDVLQLAYRGAQNYSFCVKCIYKFYQ